MIQPLSLLLAIATTVTVTPARLVDNTDIRLGARKIVLSDVVDISSVPEKIRTDAADITIMAFSGNRDRVDIAADQLARLVRLRLPAVQPGFAEGRVYVFHLPRNTLKASTGVQRNRTCLRLTKSVKMDAVIQKPDVKKGDCPLANGSSRRVYLDRSKNLVRAAENLSPGDFLDAVRLPGASFIDSGQRLTLSYREGPVTVERQVYSLQTAEAGNRIFVRTDNDDVIAAQIGGPLTIKE